MLSPNTRLNGEAVSTDKRTVHRVVDTIVAFAPLQPVSSVMKMLREFLMVIV